MPALSQFLFWLNNKRRATPVRNYTLGRDLMGSRRDGAADSPSYLHHKRKQLIIFIIDFNNLI